MTVVSISLHHAGPGGVDARDATAAAAEELHNPEAEDQCSVLLIGPVVSGHLSYVRASIAGPNLAQGAELANRSESVDSNGNPCAEVSAAEAGHAAGSDASKHRLVYTDANTNSGEENAKKDRTHRGVDVGPAGASFTAISITVIFEVYQEIGSSLNITIGATAVCVINYIVKLDG